MPLSDEHPIGAIVSSSIGAVLILVDGAVLVAASSIVLSSTSPTDQLVGGDILGLGALAIVLGLVLLATVAYLAFNPETHTAAGVVLLAVSALAFLTGGGFFLGSILGIIGGVLAIVFPYDEGAETLPGPVPAFILPLEGPSYRTATPTESCTSCGRPRAPTDSGAVCANCGAILG